MLGSFICGNYVTGVNYMAKNIAAEKAKERREKLRQIRRKQQLKMGFIIVMVVAVLVALLWLYRSDLFRIKKLEISGNDRLTDKQIEKICSIDEGTSLTRVPLKEIEDRLKKDPWIKDAKLSRSFPNTLKIKVAERTPMALIPVEDGNAVVDKDGLVLEKLSEIDRVDLLLIRDLDVNNLKVGQKIKSKSFGNASLCVSNLDAKIRNSLSIVSASSIDKLSLYTKDGVEIIYGKAENFSKKNYIIEKILREDKDEVIFIDIRVVSNPVVRKRP